jgi:dTDP-4-amino-4,6-dideoxygalactose transaminase
MTVPYVDLVALHAPLKERLLEAVGRVLDHGQFVLGPEVAELESKLAERLGVVDVVGVNSGTDALVLALRLAGVGSGDEVLTVSHSFVATATAIGLIDAVPVFVDIADETMLMDPDRLEEAITPRARAVVPVHLNGSPCDMTAIQEICHRHGLALVEDCAQAFGAEHLGRPVGTFGLGCFSLHPLKTVSVCGDGGFVAVHDQRDAERLRQWRNIGLQDRDHCRWLSGNSRLDTIQAAILLAKLEVVEDWIAARRRHAAAYRKALGSLDLRLPHQEVEGDLGTVTAFVIRHRRRDELQRRLVDRGIDAKVHYPLAIHQQEAFAAWNRGVLPVTERVVNEILSLPSGPQLSDADRNRVVAAVAASLEEVAA